MTDQVRINALGPYIFRWMVRDPKVGEIDESLRGIIFFQRSWDEIMASEWFAGQVDCDGNGLVTVRADMLKAALRPFADCCDQIADDEPDAEWAKFRLLVSDYRRARAILKSIK